MILVQVSWYPPLLPPRQALGVGARLVGDAACQPKPGRGQGPTAKGLWVIRTLTLQT
jgi:hypothetical protein